MHTYIYIYIYIRVHIYIYIYMYTHKCVRAHTLASGPARRCPRRKVFEEYLDNAIVIALVIAIVMVIVIVIVIVTIVIVTIVIVTIVIVVIVVEDLGESRGLRGVLEQQVDVALPPRGDALQVPGTEYINTYIYIYIYTYIYAHMLYIYSYPHIRICEPQGHSGASSSGPPVPGEILTRGARRGARVPEGIGCGRGLPEVLG